MAGNVSRCDMLMGVSPKELRGYLIFNGCGHIYLLLVLVFRAEVEFLDA